MTSKKQLKNKISSLEYRIKLLEKERDSLEVQIDCLRGNKRHCGEHCSVCLNSYRKYYNPFMGDSIYGCILDIKCPDFASNRPLTLRILNEEETKND